MGAVASACFFAVSSSDAAAIGTMAALAVFHAPPLDPTELRNAPILTSRKLSGKATVAARKAQHERDQTRWQK